MQVIRRRRPCRGTGGATLGATPRAVRGFKFAKLDHRCSDGVDRELDGSFPGRIKVIKVGITKRYSFFDLVERPSGRPAPNSLLVSGKLRRSAKRSKGTISNTFRFPSSLPSGETTCVNDANQDFAVRR